MLNFTTAVVLAALLAMNAGRGRAECQFMQQLVGVQCFGYVQLKEWAGGWGRGEEECERLCCALHECDTWLWHADFGCWAGEDQDYRCSPATGWVGGRGRTTFEPGSLAGAHSDDLADFLVPRRTPGEAGPGSGDATVAYPWRFHVNLEAARNVLFRTKLASAASGRRAAHSTLKVVLISPNVENEKLFIVGLEQLLAGTPIAIIPGQGNGADVLLKGNAMDGFHWPDAALEACSANICSVARILIVESTALGHEVLDDDETIIIQTPERTLLSAPPPAKALVGRGWKTVSVWVGDSTYGQDGQMSPWHAQHGQDELVVEVLLQKRNGFFVDLAAGDAIQWSNTLSLERLFDWSGLCIEPQADRLWGLVHRNCTVVQALVGSVTGDSYTLAHRGDFAGMVGPGFDNTQEVMSPAQSSGTVMQTIGVGELLARFHVPAVIDFVSLDVEGAEDLIVSAFPFDRYTVLSLSIEKPSVLCRDILRANGFHFLRARPLVDPLWKGMDPYDEFWVHSSLPNINDVLSRFAEPEHERTY